MNDFDLRGARWQPSPYVLLRLAGKPFDELARLKFDETVALFDRIIEARAALEGEKAALLELLFAEIGQHEGEMRSRLVVIKRNIFNARFPATRERHMLRAGVDARLRTEVVGYFWKLRRLKRLLSRARAQFETELAEKRELFRESCADTEFQKAIQIASPDLFRGLSEYLRAKPTALRARERQTELGIFQYLMRMTAKTSPFSRFGPIVVGGADYDAERAFTLRQHEAQPRTVASLNLGAIASLAASLARAPGVQPRLRPHLNGTAYLDGDEMVFSRPRSVWDETVSFNQGIIRRIKYVPAVRSIIELLVRHERDGLTLAEFTSRYLSSIGAEGEENRAKVEVFLARLIDAGLIVNEFRLPSNSLGRLARLREEFARVAETEEARAELSKLERLESLSRDFEAAEPGPRQQILLETRQLIADLVRRRPPIAAAQGELANPYKEDTIFAGVGYTFGRRFFASVLPEINLFLDCVAARDQGGHSYAMLRDMFVERYGAGGRCDNLLQFAAEYRGLLTKLLRAADESKHSDPRTERFNKTQRNIGQYAYTLGQNPSAPDTPRESLLAPETLRDLTRSFGESPLAARPVSMAMHVQIAADDGAQSVESGDYLVVLNYSLPGFGHFFSRYCNLLPASDDSDRDDNGGGSDNGDNGDNNSDDDHAAALFKQIKAGGEWLRGQIGRPTELVEILSILDNNAQVHPSFTRRHIVPPDEVSDLPATRQIPMSALQLTHDPATDELLLTAPREEADGDAASGDVSGDVSNDASVVSGEAGEAGEAGGVRERQLLTPLYMGFFHMIALPMLHRLLVELTPTGYHMEALQPFDLQQGGRPFRVEGDTPEQTIRRYPRLRIGRFVVQREIWEFPAAALPAREAEDEFTLFLDTYAWARRYKLPREVFVRVRRTQMQASDLHTGHKPVMVDFDNYFSLKMLFHLLHGGHVSTLEVEEMLPNPRQLFCEINGHAHAAEFQIEFNRGVEADV